MIEDIKKYNKDAREGQKFTIIIDDGTNIIVSDKDMTLSEIKEQADTGGFILQCEGLMREAIDYFSEKNVSFGLITLSSPIGFIVNKNLADIIRTEKQTSMKKARSILLENFTGNIYKEFIPLTFRLDLSKSYVPDEFLPSAYKMPMDKSYLFGSITSTDHLKPEFNEEISGIVEFSEFINKLNKFGYDIELGNYDRILSFDDYIDLYLFNVKNPGKKIQFSIVSDLSKMIKKGPSL